MASREEHAIIAISDTPTLAFATSTSAARAIVLVPPVVKPDLPLSKAQRDIVLAELHAYFAGWFPRYPYQQPTFRAEITWHDRDELPDDVTEGRIARRSTGTVSDPTYQQAIVNIYGPGKVAVWRGERVPVQPEEFRHLGRSLPTHLAVPFVRCILGDGRMVDLAEELHVSRNTISTYCDQAITVVANWLYGDRWTPDGQD